MLYKQNFFNFQRLYEAVNNKFTRKSPIKDRRLYLYNL
jgi:hypothetical protein